MKESCRPDEERIEVNETDEKEGEEEEEEGRGSRGIRLDYACRTPYCRVAAGRG